MKILSKVQGVAREFQKRIVRSSGWAAVRRQHIKNNPVCAACGSKKMLQVHHILPFKEQPELELDQNNLITLCLHRDCHVDIGHGGSYKFYCKEVKTICTSIKEGHLTLKQAKQLAANLRSLNDGNIGT